MKSHELLKYGVIAGSTAIGGIVAGPLGAIVGLGFGILHDWGLEKTLERFLPAHGEGAWKVYRYDPSSGHFLYTGMVNAGTEGEAIDAATTQVFSAYASKPYTLQGFTGTYITSQGDVFRVGTES